MAALAASSRYRLLQITFTTSHDPPRDTLNDEGTLLFFCLSHRSTKRLFLFYFVLVHDAESAHLLGTLKLDTQAADATCVLCEGESINNDRPTLGGVRGRVLALTRPIGRFCCPGGLKPCLFLVKGHRKAPPMASMLRNLHVRT